MNLRKPLIGVSLFVVVSFLLIWITYVTLDRGINSETHSYSAVFTDVTGLRAGDDVRMAGVRVGRVDKIELDGDKAKVSFRVEVDQKLYGNTKASVTYQNVIGQRYLGLSLADYHAPQQLRPGDQIGLDHTEPSFDISALLNGFEPLFGGLDPKQVDNVTEALIRALQGDNTSLVLLIEQVSSLAQSLAGPDQVLGSVITNLNHVVGDLAVHSDEVSSLITSSRSIVEGLSKHREELMGTLTEVSGMTTRMAEVVGGIQPDLDELLYREPGFTRHFMENKSEFAYLGFNLPALMKGLARVSQQGAFLDTYLCDINATFLPSLSELVPTIVGMASATGKPQYSPTCQVN
ncbi:MlaD family protein [Nocardia aurea]|uniref:MlaD family protein n=1 Tax=Nocardia aurea TaxID=2144174 RepID=A0ABV3FYJ4_9NOCA